ncbi:ATP-dependent DNA helicase UvrD/PcrA [Clostridiaceae bacterium JG1575]|nr:ATP-dependent DNA helicase UvrD/PcrA [Clostridiaceae bacterium JG1575]
MTLDPWQEAARTSIARQTLLVAPPGSGKTTVLLQKIHFLMDEIGVLPEEMLVVTFSRAAAQTMAQRFGKSAETTPYFGTLHAFARRVLLQQGESAPLITPAQAREALEQAACRYELSFLAVEKALGEFSCARAKNQGAKEVLPLAALVREDYTAYKKEHGLLDFEDLQEHLLTLLQDPVKGPKIASPYRWVLADEFQDFNDLQLSLLQELTKRASFFGVGDEDQCIYAFRGANPRAMVHFSEYFMQAEVLYLRRNYRSAAAIVRFADAAIRNNKLRNPKVIEGARSEEGTVEILSIASEEEAVDAVIRRHHRCDPPPKDALLVRTHAQMQDIARLLLKKGVPFGLLDQPFDPYQRPAPRLFCSLFRLALDVEGSTGLEALTVFPKGLPRGILARYEAQKTKGLRALLDPEGPLTRDQIHQLRRFYRDLERLRSLSLKEAIAYALYVMRYYKNLQEMALKSGVPAADLLQEVQEMGQELSLDPSLEEFVRFLAGWQVVLAQTRQEFALTLSTLHGVKGMEFDGVFMMDCVQGSIPHEKAGSDLEAERRLYYVGLTRAKEALTLLVPETLKGIPQTPSQFLPEDWVIGAREVASSKQGRRFYEGKGLAALKKIVRAGRTLGSSSLGGRP